MSEEKPRFKVTDRRLFNPDGTPRDIEREAATTNADSPAATAPATETNASRTGDVSASPAPEAARPEPTASPVAEAASESPTASATDAAPDFAATGATTATAAAEDPTPFANLVMFIASPAAAAMGMTEHPGLAPGELDLPLAKHCIDLLGTIQQKTRGNLGTQEGQIIEGLLTELRMQYISLTSAQRPPAPPRGFTGNDITGGR
ncbi:MAG TPA: DUF1844 domain-containing protein [Pyrinomonadaceae bacterium]|nr:DUF1844 domain-containing protein [Pyrinomonadaceae bacterium]